MLVRYAAWWNIHGWSCVHSHIFSICVWYLHLGYLRGVDVIDKTSFTYTGKAQSYKWRRFGFRMHIPENALPPEVDECRIHVKVSLSGQFQFPEGTELISGVYWITTAHKFLKAVTIEIQHCTKVVEHQQQISSLTYIVARCNQEDLPYQFKVLEGGVFSPHSRYGSIKLTHFSGVGISSRTPRRPSLKEMLGRRAHQPVKVYCARIYYSSRGINRWEVYIAIMWDLQLHIAVSTLNISLIGFYFKLMCVSALCTAGCWCQIC